MFSQKGDIQLKVVKNQKNITLKTRWILRKEPHTIYLGWIKKKGLPIVNYLLDRKEMFKLPGRNNIRLKTYINPENYLKDKIKWPDC